MAYHEFSVYRNSESYYSLAYWAEDTIEEETPAERYARAHDAAVANYSITTRALGQYEQGDPYSVYAIIYRMPASFDTSVIVSGAPIEAAYLRMYITSNQTTTDFDIVVQNGQPTYPHSPAVLADYNKNNYSGAGSLYNTADIPSTPVWVDIPLNETGIGWINKGVGAETKLFIRSSRDIEAIKPTMNVTEYIMSSSNSLDLRIRVTVSIPTAVTNDATNVSGSNARFNGEITDSGYWLDSYGFEWKLGLEGEVSSVTVGTNRATGLTFGYNKTGLTGTTYFRAWGANGAGKGYGEWKEIVFDAVTTQAASSIGVDHAKGNGTASAESTERGFEIKLAFSGTLYEYIEHHVAGFSTGDVTFSGGVWVGTIVKTVSEEGTFDAGAFVGDLGRFPIAVFSDKLFAGETYDYRARATIGGTENYGEWVEFTMATYPAGQGPDDQLPIEDIIVTESPPIVPVIPSLEPFESPFAEIEDIMEEFPDLVLPDFEFPEFDYDIPPYNGSWLGAFYYRKAYTKKDLDELRKKCRIFLDNSVEYALVLNHNMQVLKQFLNDMHDYAGAGEYNTFKFLIPTQWLNELAHKPLDIKDFKAIINNFISNSISNASNVNHNFTLIRGGLNVYMNVGINPIEVRTKMSIDDNPDVERLKKVIDTLSTEMANNYATINHNLRVVKATLI